MHHDHRYVEQSLALLHKVLASHACPPQGHAFWSLLDSVADFFGQEMPRHILSEETEVFPAYAGRDEGQALTALRHEHEQLLELTAGFTHWLGVVRACPNEADWAILRQHGERIAAVLAAHLKHEDEVLDRLKATAV